MVQAVIYFGKEAEGSASLDTLLAPTVYTGQRMRAILRIFHDRRHEMPMFDAVQLVLKGILTSPKSNHANLNCRPSQQSCYTRRLLLENRKACELRPRTLKEEN